MTRLKACLAALLLGAAAMPASSAPPLDEHRIAVARFGNDAPWYGCGWQREPYASLNDASAFHIAEGRWLRDRRYTDDYIDFLYEGGGNDRHFSEGIAGAV